MALDLGTLYYTIQANTRPLRQANQAVDRASRRMTSALSGVTRAAFSLQGAFAAIGAGYLGYQFIEAASRAEQLRVQLDTLTGRGQETFQKLNKWAAQMPVNTEKAIDVFKRLQAMGLDPTLKTMTRLTDASMALTGSTQGLQQISRALGQISVKGKVSAEELNQLAEAGYNARETLKKQFNLAAQDFDNLAKTFRERGISTQKVVDTLLRDMEQKFGGTSRALADSWSGLMARLQHQWWNFRREVMKSGPFQAMKKSLDSFLSYLESKKGQMQLQEWAKNTGRAIVSAFEAGARGVQGFMKGLNRAESMFAAFYQQMLEASAWMTKRRIKFVEFGPTDEKKLQKLKDHLSDIQKRIKSVEGFGTQQLINNQQIDQQFQPLYSWLNKIEGAANQNARATSKVTEEQKQFFMQLSRTSSEMRNNTQATNANTSASNRNAQAKRNQASAYQRVINRLKDQIKQQEMSEREYQKYSAIQDAEIDKYSTKANKIRTLVDRLHNMRNANTQMAGSLSETAGAMDITARASMRMGDAMSSSIRRAKKAANEATVVVDNLGRKVQQIGTGMGTVSGSQANAMFKFATRDFYNTPTRNTPPPKQGRERKLYHMYDRMTGSPLPRHDLLEFRKNPGMSAFEYAAEHTQIDPQRLMEMGYQPSEDSRYGRDGGGVNQSININMQNNGLEDPVSLADQLEQELTNRMRSGKLRRVIQDIASGRA